ERAKKSCRPKIALVRQINAAGRSTDKGHDFPHGGNARKLLFQSRQGLADRKSLPVENVEGLPDALNLLSAHPASLHTHNVHPNHDVDSLLDDEWRNVFGASRDTA